MTTYARPMNLHTATEPKCPLCLGYGQVCKEHPDLAWGPGLPSGYYPVERVCWCGSAPSPCPWGVPFAGNLGRSVRMADAVGLEE